MGGGRVAVMGWKALHTFDCDSGKWVGCDFGMG